MIFWIWIALIVVVPLLFLRFTRSRYDRWTNFVGSLAVSVLVGGMLFVLICSSAGAQYTVVTSEKTFTVDNSATPTFSDREVLNFQYTENGKTLPFSQEIQDTTVPIGQVKEIKIKVMDAVHPMIAPFNLGWGYRAEFIK